MRWLRLRALLTVNLVLFFLFLLGVLFTGHARENEELTEHGQPTQSLIEYPTSPAFGEPLGD